VLDVSDMTMGARVRFMTGFLDELYRANRQPLTLVIDEADLFAPQRALPDQTVMLSRMEQICRRGRVRGFRPWLISQRPAELHKSVLSQANTLIAMQLTAPQDRDAIGAWIEGQADRDEGKKVLADLPKLKKGEGWVWSPSHDVLKRAKFPRIKTFDSSRTPEEGEAAAPVALADVDLSRDPQAVRDRAREDRGRRSRAAARADRGARGAPERAVDRST
jgi:DNA helicase HerA-like ATPase